MIFGFNTDIKHQDTVYHVQSEAREGEQLLQTQVFVRGRCIGKRATPYAEQAQSPDFTDQKKEQILREQHRVVLDAIRDGRLDQVFDRRETPESLAAEKELDIQWLNSGSVHAENKLSMKLRATEAGQGIAGARMTGNIGLTCNDSLGERPGPCRRGPPASRPLLAATPLAA